MKSATRALIGFDDRPFMLIGIPAVAAILPFMAKGIYGETPVEGYLIKVAVGIFFTSIYWFSGRVLCLNLRKRYPGPEHTLRRYLWYALFIVGLIVLMSFVCNHLIFAILNSNGLAPVEAKPDSVGIAFLSFVLSVTVMGIYEVAWVVQHWRESLVEAERLRRENIQSQLDILKSQVNPHFLFNSLNTLSSLVHENPDLSVEFIQKLSKTYRYVLEIKDRELISLEEEMECVHAYLFLLRIRFEDALEVEIDIPAPFLQYHVAPLSVQTLIENAIKHNVAARKRPLRIRLHIDAQERLVVVNNLQPKEQNGESTGTGLANIQARYQLLVRKEVSVTKTADGFSVAIPLIKLERYASDHH
jgi:two-component system, LytTR family, sensor kinase